MKLILEQQYMLSVPHSQYHACWCIGDFRSQCISRCGIYPQSQNIPSPVSEELRCTFHNFPMLNMGVLVAGKYCVFDCQMHLSDKCLAGFYCEIALWWMSQDLALRWMPQDLTNDKSALIQVLAWCHQSINHFLNHCQHRSTTLWYKHPLLCFYFCFHLEL